MNDNEMRDRLSEALWRLDIPPEPPIPWPDKWADALLPVVRGLIADELRAAADDIDDWAANAQRYQATVESDSIEHAAATARLLAYERARNVLRRRVAAETEPRP